MCMHFGFAVHDDRFPTQNFQLQLDVEKIDFGTTVIGETIRRSFTLSNRGALGTKFDFFKVTGE